MLRSTSIPTRPSLVLPRLVHKHQHCRPLAGRVASHDWEKFRVMLEDRFAAPDRYRATTAIAVVELTSA